jgi:hypothetical protein
MDNTRMTANHTRHAYLLDSLGKCRGSVLLLADIALKIVRLDRGLCKMRFGLCSADNVERYNAAPRGASRLSITSPSVPAQPEITTTFHRCLQVPFSLRSKYD